MVFRKAQSITEYLVLFGALIIVIMFGAVNMSRKVSRNYVTAGHVADNTANVLADELNIARAADVADYTPAIKTKKLKFDETTRYKNALSACQKKCKNVANQGKSACMGDCMETWGYTR